MSVYTLGMPNGKTVTVEADNLTAEQIEALRVEFSDTPARPARPVPAAQAAPRSELDIGMGGVAAAANSVVEPALTMLTGAVAEPAAGIAGLLGSVLPGAEGQGARFVYGTRDAMTFEPRSEAGNRTLADLANLAPVQAATNAVSTAERTLGDLGAEHVGPIGGAVGATIPATLLEVLGFKGGQTLKRAREFSQPLVDQGLPTEELRAALRRAGLQLSDLPPGAVDELQRLKRGANPDEALRASRFDSEDIPHTRGDTSQDFAEQAREQRLLAQANEPESEPLRQLKLNQSEAFQRSVIDLVDSLGVPGEAGAQMKDALIGRKKMLREKKNDLYRKFAEAAPEVRDIPLASDEIAAVAPSFETMESLARTAGEDTLMRLESILTHYGIVTDGDAVQRYSKGTTLGRPNKIRPLSVGNLEAFRQELNLLARGDSSGAVNVATGPIIKALDNETRIVDGALREAGVDVDAIPALVEARETVRTLKTEFSPQSIVGKLTSFKPDGRTPTIEASKAAGNVLREPIENLQRVVASLEKAGADGEKVINHMQSKVVFDALEQALKGASRKINGIPTINGNQFHKHLDKIGRDRIDLLFASNKEAFNRLQALRGVAVDMMPSAAAMPKGSASVNLDIFKRVGRMPGIAAEVINFALDKASKGREVRRALDGNPQLKSKAEDFRQNWPTIAVVLGIGAGRDEE